MSDDQLPLSSETGGQPPIRANRADKITEETVISHLLFVFYSHNADYYRQIQVGSKIDEAIDQLIKILDRLYIEIKKGNFIRRRAGKDGADASEIRSFIDDRFIQKNFRGRKLHQYYKDIRAKKLRYTPMKATIVRNIFISICSVARDIFRERDTQGYEYVDEIRELVGLVPDPDGYAEQLKVLGQIETTLKRIEAKPSGAFSFTGYDNEPVIKTSKIEYFPGREEKARSERAIDGRFIVYRRVFHKISPNEDYIREYLVIESRRPYGYLFRWETQGGIHNVASTITGIAIFTDGACWLIGHCEDPFKRMRVMAINIKEWQHHQIEPEIQSFCTGVVLSHRDAGGEKFPEGRTAILRRETSADWETESFDRRVRGLTGKDIEDILSADQIAFLDGR